MKNIRLSKVSYLAFLISIFIVCITLVSLFFPAFLSTSISGSESDVNSFELGAWAIPFFSINLSILILGLLYYKQFLPKIITKSFKFILNFEVSSRVTITVFSIIIGLYIIFTVEEISQSEGEIWHDWKFVEPMIENFPYGVEGEPELSFLYVKNFLLYSSQELFQNVKIIPFIGSISLIFLTYFLTVRISGKRFAGLVSIVILLQSHTFLRYDTTATFSNFWTAFYLFSLFLIYKKWQFSPLAYLASIFSKALTLSFFPMTLFFIFRSEIPKKTKIRVTLSYLIIFAGIIGVLFLAKDFGYGEALTSFEYDEFVSGFTAFVFQLRIDGLVLVFLLPLTIGLFIKSYQGTRQADSILVLIAGILLAAPLLAGFSVFNIQPYRWIPLIVFFSIGVGTLLSKTSIDRSEK